VEIGLNAGGVGIKALPEFLAEKLQLFSERLHWGDFQGFGHG
jgi:hypothetical protein